MLLLLLLFYHVSRLTFYRTYLVTSSAGGLEGCKPSKNCFFPPDCATPRGYPAAQSGGKESILGRPGTLWVSPQTPPPRKSWRLKCETYTQQAIHVSRFTFHVSR